jgi:hypothetical protein
VLKWIEHEYGFGLWTASELIPATGSCEHGSINGEKFLEYWNDCCLNKDYVP